MRTALLRLLLSAVVVTLAAGSPSLLPGTEGHHHDGTHQVVNEDGADGAAHEHSSSTETTPRRTV